MLISSGMTLDQSGGDPLASLVTRTGPMTLHVSQYVEDDCGIPLSLVVREASWDDTNTGLIWVPFTQSRQVEACNLRRQAPC